MDVPRRARRNLDVEFCEGDMAQPLPFPDGAFGAVMSNCGAPLLRDRTVRAVLSEVRRVLQPAHWCC